MNSRPTVSGPERKSYALTGDLQVVPQRRFQPRQQFRHVKGLGDIVVSAKLQRPNLALDIASRRQNHDRRQRGLTNPFDDGEPVAIWQTQIQQHEVRCHLGQCRPGRWRHLPLRRIHSHAAAGCCAEAALSAARHPRSGAGEASSYPRLHLECGNAEGEDSALPVGAIWPQTGVPLKRSQRSRALPTDRARFPATLRSTLRTR